MRTKPEHPSSERIERLRELTKKCSEEPITRLGLVQSYGFSLVGDYSGKLVAHSDKASEFLGENITLGSQISSWLPKSTKWVNVIKRLKRAPFYTIGEVCFNKLHWDVRAFSILGKNNKFGLVGLDFLPIYGPGYKNDEVSLFESISYLLSAVSTEESLIEFSNECVKQIQSFTQYDRVLLYQFDSLDNGEVIAEAFSPGLEKKYLNLKFPESDIPKQARELYRINPLRVIADVDALPQTWITQDIGEIDQTFGLLRQPSEVHIQYCKNMGLRSTLTISLLSEGRLWGLVACHHYEPRIPSLDNQRTLMSVCHLMSYVLSSNLGSLGRIEKLSFEKNGLMVIERHVDSLKREVDLNAIYSEEIKKVLSFFNADAWIIRINGNWFGLQLDNSFLCKIEALINTIEGDCYTSGCDNVMATEGYPGIVIMILDSSKAYVIVMLRREKVHNVSWGGRPDKIDLNHETMSLQPRNSFDLWRETVRGRAEEWTQSEITLIRELLRVQSKKMLELQVESQRAELLKLGTSLSYLSEAVVLTNSTSSSEGGPVITYSNDACSHLTGYNSEELLGKSLKIFQGPGTDRAIINKVRKAIEDKRPINVDLLNYRKSGEPFWTNLTVAPVFDDLKNCFSFISIQRDITGIELERRVTELQRYFLFHLIEKMPIVLAFIVIKHGIVSIKFVSDYSIELLKLESRNIIDDPGVFLSCLRDFDVMSWWESIKLNVKEKVGSEQLIFNHGGSEKHDKFLNVHYYVNNQDSEYQEVYLMIGDRTVEKMHQQESERLYFDLFKTIEALPDFLIEVTADGTVTKFHQPPDQEVFGSISRKKLNRLEDIFTESIVEKFYQSFRDCKSGDSVGRFEFESDLRSDDGIRVFDVYVTHKEREVNNVNEASYICILREITQRKTAEAYTAKLAYEDQLTGLLNRYSFMDLANSMLSSCVRSDRYMVLIYMDLDQFKSLNDTRGHHIGDHLLIEVAKRLRMRARKEDLVARFGGDEFVLAYTGFKSKAAAAMHATEIAKGLGVSLAEPYHLENTQYRTSASLGIAVDGGSECVATINTLLRRGDMAMYLAKERGRGGWEFFDSDLESEVLKRNVFEQELKIAVQNRQMEVYFQPIVDREKGLVSYEALLRWYHPTFGQVSPADFIPVAEQSNLISDLGEQVLKHSMGLIESWQNEGVNLNVTIAVNISPIQIAEPDFVGRVVKLLNEYGVKGKFIKLEVTESLVQEDITNTISVVEALSNHGVQFALDDFGTGYSSLSYLARLPIHSLKIDKSFVDDLLTDQADYEVVRSIIGLAASLKREVVAEGVESEQQYLMLKNMGCDFFQGYYFGRPGLIS